MNYLDILVKLRKVIRSINLESKRIEKELGISIPQLLILQYLSQQTDFKASAKDIKSYIKLNASTVTGIVKRLEKKGLTVKTPHDKDRRYNYIVLTAKGAQLLSQSPTTLQEKIAGRITQLDNQKLQELGKNIDLLVSIMDAENIDASPVVTIVDFDTEK